MLGKTDVALKMLHKQQAFRYTVLYCFVLTFILSQGKEANMKMGSGKTSNNADKTHKYTNCANSCAVPFDHK